MNPMNQQLREKVQAAARKRQQEERFKRDALELLEECSKSLGWHDPLRSRVVVFIYEHAGELAL